MNSTPNFENLAPGVVILRQRVVDQTAPICEAVDWVVARAPYRNPMTPYGKPMSVSMTNCGVVGWVSDSGGYRYESKDPMTDQPWPEMPDVLSELAIQLAGQAGYHQYRPDVCLVNRYRPGALMGMHRDADERDLRYPIVSISLGLPMTFRLGGLRRGGATLQTMLHHGDVMIMGDSARLRYHGVSKLKPGIHPLIGSNRINLTFRVAL